MKDSRGRNIRLSIPRRLIADMCYFAQKVPSVPVQRRINVSAAQRVRANLAVRPSWCVIFTKAYGITAARFPELRRAFLPYPWPHLYEHPFSIASVAVERVYQNEPGVFWGHLHQPEEKPLAALDKSLSHYKEASFWEVGLFRRAVKMNRLPGPLRRFMWRVGLYSSGHKRAKRMGTFGVSVYSALGAESFHPLSPLTTTLNYGVLDPDGGVNVRIVYDHRVMDGSTVARALGCLEEVLNQEIVRELKNSAEAMAA